MPANKKYTDQYIKTNFEAFGLLGRKAKELSNEDYQQGTEYQIKCIYSVMANIARDLEPAKDKFCQENELMNELFERLLEIK